MRTFKETVGECDCDQQACLIVFESLSFGRSPDRGFLYIVKLWCIYGVCIKDIGRREPGVCKLSWKYTGGQKKDVNFPYYIFFNGFTPLHTFFRKILWHYTFDIWHIYLSANISHCQHEFIIKLCIQSYQKQRIRSTNSIKKYQIYIYKHSHKYTCIWLTSTLEKHTQILHIWEMWRHRTLKLYIRRTNIIHAGVTGFYPDCKNRP